MGVHIHGFLEASSALAFQKSVALVADVALGGLGAPRLLSFPNRKLCCFWGGFCHMLWGVFVP